MTKLDPKIRTLAEKVIAEGKNKRAIAVLKVLLSRGKISTDDLNRMGYNHPPRAVGDVRDAGIPIVTGSETSPKTGRRMAVYTFGDPSHIQAGRVGGRSAFPKDFKKTLIERYGSKDCITGAVLDPRVLQIDHRVPYRISGDEMGELNVEEYMLLDGSSQRAKSWSCEHCPNMLKTKLAAICETCFWAYPEEYEHIATENYRRVDLTWQGEDVKLYDELDKEAEKRGVSVADFIRELVRQRSKRT